MSNLLGVFGGMDCLLCLLSLDVEFLSDNLSGLLVGLVDLLGNGLLGSGLSLSQLLLQDGDIFDNLNGFLGGSLVSFSSLLGDLLTLLGLLGDLLGLNSDLSLFDDLLGNGFDLLDSGKGFS